MRLSVNVDGAPKSKNLTRSQITNTLILGSTSFFIVFSNAEAPCKHTAQVGDNSTRMRTESDEPLNALLKEAIFELSSRVRGC